MAANIPGTAFKLTYDERYDDLPSKVTVLSVPGGSAIAVGAELTVSSTYKEYSHGTSAPFFFVSVETRTFSFVPDVSGIYRIALLIGETTTEAQVEIATKLSHRIGAIEKATLTVYVQAGAVVPASDSGGTYPKLGGFSSAREAFCAASSGVKSAVASLGGMTTANLMATGLPAVEAAWIAALEAPSSVDGQAMPVVEMVASGWELG